MTRWTAHFTPTPTNPDATPDTTTWDITDHINNLDTRLSDAIVETVNRNGRWWDNDGDTLHAAGTPAHVTSWPGPYDLYVTRDNDNTDDTDDNTIGDLLGTIWLHTSWHQLTRHMTTKQRELYADHIDNWQPDPDDPFERRPVERWWQDQTPTNPA